MSAPPDFYYGRVITGVEIYHTQFLTPINFNGRPGNYNRQQIYSIRIVTASDLTNLSHLNSTIVRI